MTATKGDTNPCVPFLPALSRIEMLTLSSHPVHAGEVVVDTVNNN